MRAEDGATKRKELLSAHSSTGNVKDVKYDQKKKSNSGHVFFIKNQQMQD